MIKSLLQKHSSFLILTIGSIAYYFLNVLLKHFISIDDYGEYGVFNSYLSIVMTFALIGGEQLLMRVAKNEANSLVVPNSIFKAIIIAGVVFSIASSIFYYRFYSDKISYIYILLVCLLSAINILGFSVFRIGGLYIEAQLQKNGWRIVLIVGLAIYLLISRTITLNIVILFFNVSLFILFVRGILKLKKVNLKDTSYKIDYRLWLGYASAMLIMNLMSNSDRFIIDSYLGKDKVGNYFYLQNFFLFPLTQVQAYVGFKELNVFKKEFSMKYLNNRLLQNFFLGLGIAIVTTGGIFIVNLIIPKLEINWGRNLWLIILLLITGICRTVYSILSAAMGAIGNYHMIRYTNVLTIIFFFLAFGALYLIGFSVIKVAIFFLIVWLFRCIIYYYYFLKYEV